MVGQPSARLTVCGRACYLKTVVAIDETIRSMVEIDEAIERRGSWPDAFANSE